MTVERDLGSFEARLDGLERRLDKIEEQLVCLNASVASAKGGWKVLLLLSGAAATVGGLVGQAARMMGE